MCVKYEVDYFLRIYPWLIQIYFNSLWPYHLFEASCFIFIEMVQRFINLDQLCVYECRSYFYLCRAPNHKSQSTIRKAFITFYDPNSESSKCSRFTRTPILFHRATRFIKTGKKRLLKKYTIQIVFRFAASVNT